MGIGEGLDGPGGDPCIEITGLELHALGDEGTCGNQGFVGDFGVIQNDSSHTDQDAITNFAAVDDGAVADSDFVTDFERSFLIGAVEDGAILDVCAIANANIVYIAPDDDMVPDAAGITDHHIADDNGGFGKEGVGSDLRGFSEERADDRHIQR